MNVGVAAQEAAREKRGQREQRGTWSRPLAKVGAAIVGLVVLAVIGRVSGASGLLGAAAAAETSLAIPDAGAPEPAASVPEAVRAVVVAPPEPRAESRPARASPEAPVVLNRADVTELRRLPGVGEKRAAAILTLRARLGRFRRIEDLLRVKGVGRRTLQRWRPLVVLDAPASAAADAGAP